MSTPYEQFMGLDASKITDKDLALKIERLFNLQNLTQRAFDAASANETAIIEKWVASEENCVKIDEKLTLVSNELAVFRATPIDHTVCDNKLAAAELEIQKLSDNNRDLAKELATTTIENKTLSDKVVELEKLLNDAKAEITRLTDNGTKLGIDLVQAENCIKLKNAEIDNGLNMIKLLEATNVAQQKTIANLNGGKTPSTPGNLTTNTLVATTPVVKTFSSKLKVVELVDLLVKAGSPTNSAVLKFKSLEALQAELSKFGYSMTD